MKKNVTNKRNKKRILMFILLIILLAIILLIGITSNNQKGLLSISEKVAQVNYTSQIANKEYDISNKIANPPNSPLISAGMIPVKYNGVNWIITTKEDANWYNYNEGKPAYMMLNDGKYVSEMVTTNKSLAVSGTIVPASSMGTLYVWIPRYAYYNNTGDIIYIKQQSQVAGDVILPRMFTYELENRDFSLSGVWVEKTPESSTTIDANIKKMTGKNNSYCFLANTIPVNGAKETTTKDTISNFDKNSQMIDDVSNINRLIIKVVEDKKIEPIKARAEYNKNTKKIDIVVEHSQYGIQKILDENGNELEITTTDGIITANTGNETIYNRDYKFIIIDVEGNQKEIILGITTAYEQIEATILYNEATGKIEITVTQNMEEIQSIVDADGQELTLATTEDGLVTANTGDKYIQNGEYNFTITDVTGYTKQLTIKVTTVSASIEANATYSSSKITVTVTYSKFEISKIKDDDGNDLTLTKNATTNIVTANTGDKPINNGTYNFTIIDVEGNTKKVSCTVTTSTLSYYYIATESQLNNFISAVNNGQNTKKGYQVKDITLTSSISALGTGNSAAKGFAGVYDGGGHTINLNGKGITPYSSSSSSTNDVCGFVAFLYNGTVKNLEITRWFN